MKDTLLPVPYRRPWLQMQRNYLHQHPLADRLTSSQHPTRTTCHVIPNPSRHHHPTNQASHLTRLPSPPHHRARNNPHPILDRPPRPRRHSAPAPTASSASASRSSKRTHTYASFSPAPHGATPAGLTQWFDRLSTRGTAGRRARG